jgi:hypothetical protein
MMFWKALSKNKRAFSNKKKTLNSQGFFSSFKRLFRLLELAPFRMKRWLLRRHGASPSTSLDKKKTKHMKLRPFQSKTKTGNTNPSKKGCISG